MTAVLRVLRRQAFALAIVLCASSAFLFPGWYDSWFGVKLMPFVGPSIQLIMFGMGTTLTAADFVRVAKTPWSVAVGAVLQFSVMPFAALGVAKALGFEGELAAGMVLIGSVAGGMASNVIAYLARANVALSVTMTCVSTLLSPVVTPFLMKTLAGAYVEIDTLKMMVEMVKIVLLPVGAGLVLRLALGRRYEANKRLVDGLLQAVSMFGICFSLVVCVAPNSGRIREAGLVILLSSVLHTAVGYSLGYWVTRLLGRFLPIDERDARTVAIEVGMQNGGMAAALAVNVLHSTVAALPANAAAIWMNLSGSMLANYWNKRPVKEKGMLEKLKKAVCAANVRLGKSGLVSLTWGNVSGFDPASGLLAIKPSGVAYDELTPEKMVVVDLDGKVVEGTLRPSSDTPTHAAFYRTFPGVCGAVHTHSAEATAWAQAALEIPCLGTTHADVFHGPVPVARFLTAAEVDEAYEENTGKVIVERFAALDPLSVPGVLVAGHGPFTWGKTPDAAVDAAISLEAIAHMARLTRSLAPKTPDLPAYVLEKHHARKHGPKAYYGQA